MPLQERMLLVIGRAGRKGVLHTQLTEDMWSENRETGQRVPMKPQACHHLTKVQSICPPKLL